MKISIDAMGGDRAPQAILEGAALASSKNDALRFLLHGDEAKLLPLLDSLPALKAVSTICHADKAVAMDEAPMQALRKEGRQSSMWKCLEAVAQGNADVAISAGNTGALMGMSKIVLRCLPGVERPAIAGRWPNKKGEMSLVLDLGATISPSAQQLLQFSIMGVAAARSLLEVKQPKVGLLNVGIEDIKGTPEIKEAAQLCQKYLPNNFYGFIEGDDISSGIVDVVVTDGFSGNIALKSAEGTSRLLFDMIKERIGSSFATKLGGLLMRSALRSIGKTLDPGRYNGGVFLGLEGIAVKSHGGCDAQSFASAVEAAYRLGGGNLVETMKRELASVANDKKTQEAS